MYHEERIINGVMHYRTRPTDEFTAYTIEELSRRYERVKHELSAYILAARANQEAK